jgi:hypothetical protein
MVTCLRTGIGTQDFSNTKKLSRDVVVGQEEMDELAIAYVLTHP